MQTKELRILVYEYDSISDLTDVDRKLVLAAREVALKAYAPYSKLFVGSSVLLANNKIISGNNQENMAFSTGLCAERVALFYANATFPGMPVKALAVSAIDHKGIIDDPVKPCGSCRQVIYETETRFDQTIRIILDGKKMIQVFEGIKNLLPFAFKLGSRD